MVPKRLLIANRGEVAIRIARTAADMGIATVAVFSEDDATSLHTRKADEAHGLHGIGAAAYLDIEQLITAAQTYRCDAIHPGYGFLSENANFARRCLDAGITFVGPSPEILELSGDKLRARALAARCGVPVLRATAHPASIEETHEFFSMLEPGSAIMIKAVAGGGGRGIREVFDSSQIQDAYARCQSEALAAFGNGDVYLEQMMPRARHIEVQIAGDSSGHVIHLGERECSIQRRHQKLLEMAPSPHLTPGLRERLTAAALRMAQAAHYQNLGTFEFLLDADDDSEQAAFAFIETNPRLQVEHTVTEAITGLDLVKLQLQLASGYSLAELQMIQNTHSPRGLAMQVRINMETMGPDGRAKPSGGALRVFEPPSGPGVRVDTFGYSGFAPSVRFDSLLAKLIVHSAEDDFNVLVRKTYRALCEFRIEGVPTNIGFLKNLLGSGDFVKHKLHTRFVDEHITELASTADSRHRRLFFEASPISREVAGRRLAGVKIDTTDPLAVLNLGKSAERAPTNGPAAANAPMASAEGSENTVPVAAPIQGTIVTLDVHEGEQVRIGQQLLVMEAMKMEHVINAQVSGTVRQIMVAIGDAIFEGHLLIFIEPGEVAAAQTAPVGRLDLDFIRPDLAAVIERHEFGLDRARPEAVERRRKTGQRTARENIEDLCDPGTFVEYGPLVIAAQRRRRSLDDLIRRTPADGMLAGIGRVNGGLFDQSRTRCIAMSYDYTVLAGTQGGQNHRKKDRIFELAEKWRLPVIFFTEGGGGRPGDTDGLTAVGLDTMAFHLFGRLSGLVPLIAINSGRCFAGNAAILGCCDVVIATSNSNIGMGGPAMIEGGGLGVFRPEEIGGIDVQAPNGVVDIPVADEACGVRVAKKYLSYFQGELANWTCADQRLLRGSIPENRLRVYDIRTVIQTLADTDSVLELRRQFGPGMVTALIRIEGRPLGLIANNPAYLAGAIDSNGADKAARFMQLCDAFDLPILFLCDTPGIMVGPQIEKSALVRHAARMFVTGASLSVPFFTIVLRKAYGLGAQAMAGGSFKAPLFTVSWPTGEFGGMGLEGAVKLGYRNEIEAINDPAERKAFYDKLVARMYEVGKAVNIASHFEFDEVIDPLDSRKWIIAALGSLPPLSSRSRKKRPCVDTW
ncbi:MAG: carbamoyl-phosphate synthase large subunit [Deltaproteobacteria bacterium]|nr:carbamoyl-phosphate synthase large subunit [Deltaproteobacteria bacterium]